MAISEDIKILKDVIHDRDSLSERDFKAIENILHRVEELEHECKWCIIRSELSDYINMTEKLEKENAELKAMLKNRIKYTQELEQDLFENCSNYVVPKSVIREKIDKLEREFHFFAGREHAEWQDGEFDGEVCDDLALQIGTLKKLLGE